MRFLSTLIAFLFLFPLVGSSQGTDSTITEKVDSLLSMDSSVYENSYDESVVYSAPADSSIIDARSFDPGKVEELKNDPDLNYKEPPMIAESLWDRLMTWLRDFFNSAFNKAFTTEWGKLIVYLLAIAAIVVIVMLLLKVNAFKIFYSGVDNKVKYQVLDENIHEMNFEKLIQEAISQKDYRKAIRLLFLNSLKLLSDKQLIHWRPGKTNHDYVSELEKRELKTGFNELSFYFDYAWYGNFAITEETFAKVNNIFSDWRSKIR